MEQLTLGKLQYKSTLNETIEYINNRLITEGYALLRETGIATKNDFLSFVETIDESPSQYVDPSTPRTEVQKHIYTSTDYPRDQSIPFHNELSYSNNWPKRIYFFCEHPASYGGLTPISSNKEMMASLNSELLKKFADLGVLYQRVYHPGLGVSITDTFGTDDPDELSTIARERGLELEWIDGALRTVWRHPALRSHPDDGNEIWFNHAYLFNHQSLQERTRMGLHDILGSTNLFPYNSYFGDGTHISPEEFFMIDAAFSACAISHEWKAGDILVLDNQKFAHSRLPFEGARSVLVAMTQMQSRVHEKR